MWIDELPYRKSMKGITIRRFWLCAWVRWPPKADIGHFCSSIAILWLRVV